jgi:hypothetical protein
MNARMIFGLFWLGLVGLLSYIPNLPGGYWLLGGNAAIGLVALVWGASAQGGRAGQDDE